MTELDDHKALPKRIFSVGSEILNLIKQNHKVKLKKLLCHVKTETNEANLCTQEI